MTQNRRQWAAISYPDQPTHLSEGAVARRAKTRIGVRVALITLPIMLAAGLAALAGSGGSSDGPTSTPLYPGDKIGFAVGLQLHSHGLLAGGVRVDCDGSTLAVGSVSSCGEYNDSGDGAPGPSFDVQFLDRQGHFSFTAPDGSVLHGSLVG